VTTTDPARVPTAIGARVVEVVGLTRGRARHGRRRVSVRLEPGTFVALLGPSGCGKTTLLRMLAGFEQPTAGEIFINDEPVADVPPYRRAVNTVFQHFALFPHMDVARNVGYGLRQRRPAPSREEQERRVAQALELVRLTGYDHRRVWELSGGQQQGLARQRSSTARPSSSRRAARALDPSSGARRSSQAAPGAGGITFIFVTHDQNEAFSMADRGGHATA
jgi:spermidine/putrescine transport system ATP-binding protein